MFRADFFLKKPAVQELITNGNDHVLRYLYKLQEMCKDQSGLFSGKLETLIFCFDILYVFIIFLWEGRL